MRVRRERSVWHPEELELLGTGSDAEIARKLGRTEEVIRLKRQNLGAEAPQQPAWTDQDIRLLGTRPDRQIARLTGRSLTAVQTKRLDLKIKSCWSHPTRSSEPLDP